VTVETVSAQLLYEMGKPDEYLTPDVTADFSSVRLEQAGENRVDVSDIRGGPNTPFLKVSASYLAGFKAAGTLTVTGPRAVDKARLCADIVWKRLQRSGVTSAKPPATKIRSATAPPGVPASAR